MEKSSLTAAPESGDFQRGDISAGSCTFPWRELGKIE